jgi:hypothetical protein
MRAGTSRITAVASASVSSLGTPPHVSCHLLSQKGIILGLSRLAGGIGFVSHDGHLVRVVARKLESGLVSRAPAHRPPTLCVSRFFNGARLLNKRFPVNRSSLRILSLLRDGSVSYFFPPLTPTSRLSAVATRSTLGPPVSPTRPRPSTGAHRCWQGGRSDGHTGRGRGKGPYGGARTHGRSVRGSRGVAPAAPTFYTSLQ